VLSRLCAELRLCAVVIQQHNDYLRIRKSPSPRAENQPSWSNSSQWGSTPEEYRLSSRPVYRLGPSSNSHLPAAEHIDWSGPNNLSTTQTEPSTIDLPAYQYNTENFPQSSYSGLPWGAFPDPHWIAPVLPKWPEQPRQSNSPSGPQLEAFPTPFISHSPTPVFPSLRQREPPSITPPTPDSNRLLIARDNPLRKCPYCDKSFSSREGRLLESVLQ
jgi:hypothetical protein